MRNDTDGNDDQQADFDPRLGEVDDEDSELGEFEALPAAERLVRVLVELREKFQYCFWCKFRYPNAEMEGCPGLSEDEHD